ncbi:hypothetical protein [Cellulomonas sp. Leaf334]|uniref:hypothetical protein n=1 Tax=Cellulomonas sp. Leaf334 TaxID=1736339 RepID=UPI0006F3C372|nr:hypothetical protein [Cellulomonas sp. Leaf334]KQR17269.1 hypothetical protein ASF78_08215 [Cellulomonas sp. Leaf334]
MRSSIVRDHARGGAWIRGVYQPPPLILAKRGRRSIFVRQPPSRGAWAFLDELVAGARRVAVLRAIASTVRMIGRPRELARELSVVDVERIPMRELVPVRRPPAYTTMKNYVGMYPILDPQGFYRVWHESLLEAAHLRELEWAGVLDINAQVLRLEWEVFSGRYVYAYPDFIFRYNGQITIVSVGARRFLHERRRLQYDLISLVCEMFGWRHEVGLDDISLPRQRNLRYLMGQRETLTGEPQLGPAAPDLLSFWTLANLEGGDWIGTSRATARLWRREYTFDLDDYLEDTTVMHLGGLVPPVRHTWEVVGR